VFGIKALEMKRNKKTKYRTLTIIAFCFLLLSCNYSNNLDYSKTKRQTAMDSSNQKIETNK